MYTIKKLPDICTIKTGKMDANHATPNGKYRFYTCASQYCYCDTKSFSGPSVIVPGNGDIGLVFYYDGEFEAYQRTYVLSDIKIYPKYLYYHMVYKWRYINSGKQYGSTVRYVRMGNFSNYEIPVPEFSKQKEIVLRIEESLSQLDSAVETLKKTKLQLEIYRQAVLKEAFDTAISDCRMLSIGDLLTTERKGMTTGPFGTMIKKSDHLTSGVPILGIENIGRGRFVAGNRIFVSAEKAKELSSFQVTEGDLIISRSGTVGEICAIPNQAEGALLSTNLMRITLNNRIILNDYFIALFQSKGIVLDQIKELCKGSTRLFLNQSILKRISFPVPALSKQQRIVDVLNARTEAIKPIEKTINYSLLQAEVLRQSILKKAFFYE